ncbi:MAG TPA: patatin-like phospholipase family protein [Bacteroidia bacterium]|nr:patatin-like phospholipase family protein [Bacteroidia bacterium]
MYKSIFAVLLSLCFVSGFGQRPKVGLALSGGGAKGLAHIGLLKVIDSAGLKIDYIAGTSMGAILGGLYSIGYSGNELEKIARDARWEAILASNIPLTAVNIEEKDEYGRYVAELPMIGLRPSLPLGMFEGQELSKLLTQLTFHAQQVSSFDSLPIPFRCLGADILTGEAVVLKDGYLPTAMRASMAIPSVFTPVKYKEHLLVDGGLVRNFPVTDVKEMGGEIIIGGYTGGRLFTEEELTSAIKVIYQSASFNRIADSEMQKGLCTILADYDKELQNYSTASFRKTDSVIDIGYRVALTLYPRLKKLADSLNALGVYKIDTLSRIYNKKVLISDIQTDGATMDTRHLVLGKLGLKAGNEYKIDEINEGINTVYGTRFFDEVYYTLEPVGDGNKLTVHVRESRRAAFKFALHYDNEQAAGILVNLTLRNALGAGSRTLLTADISEFPKIRAQYQKFIDPSQQYWMSTGYLYDFSPFRRYNMGRLRQELTNAHNNFFVGINRTINRRSYAGVSINTETNLTRTKIQPEDQANPDSFSFKATAAGEIGLNVNYLYHSLNSFLFPTKGRRIFINIKYIPVHSYTSDYFVKNGGFPNNTYQVKNTLSQAVKLNITYTWIKRLSRKFSWVNNFFGGIIIDGFNHGRERYYSGALQNLYYAGGLEFRARQGLIPFTGLREMELAAGQMLLLKSELQIEPLKKLYITPGVAFIA